MQSFARAPVVGAFVAAWLFARPALADATFALTWEAEGKRSCITEKALRAAVERKIGRPLSDVAHADIVIEGRETPRTADHVGAQVTQRTHDGVRLGSRTIDARDCQGLQQAATLVVALIVQADQEEGAAGRHSDEETAKAPRAEPALAPPSTPSTPSTLPATSPERAPRDSGARQQPRPKTSRFELSLGAGVEASSGLLPSLAGSLEGYARLELTNSPWSFDWMGGYALPQTLHRGDAFGEFSALEQRVRICAAPFERHALSLELCGGALWAVVIPETSGTLAGRDAWSSIVAPLASIGVDLTRAGAALRLDAGAALPLRRYSFTYLDVEGDLRSFYTTGQVVFFVSVGGRLTIF